MTRPEQDLRRSRASDSLPQPSVPPRHLVPANALWPASRDRERSALQRQRRHGTRPAGSVRSDVIRPCASRVSCFAGGGRFRNGHAADPFPAPEALGAATVRRTWTAPPSLRISNPPAFSARVLRFAQP